MKKALVLLFMTVVVSHLFSNEYNIAWNEPEISSRSKTSFLQESDYTVSYYPSRMEPDDKSAIYFALDSWTNFKKALKEFFFFSSDNKKFLQYYTPRNTTPSRSFYNLSLYTGIDIVSDIDEDYYFYYFGTHVSGSIDRKFDFYANWWKGHFSGDMDYAESSQLIDSWTQSNSDSTETYLDNVTGRIQYWVAPWWKVALGRGKYEIGNNIGGSIILNDDCNDYGYLSTKFNFHNFELSFIHTSLVADSTKGGSKDYPDKYLATHKLNWKAADNLEFFIGEHVIYGDRSIDVNYLLPLSFWRLAEHNLRDRDNVLIYAGINLRPPNNHNHLVYFNLIIDELSTGELLNNWWGNKYAMQSGYSYLFLYPPLSRITFEFTAVRPWLYTHKYIHTKFSQDDRSLGFPAGCNLIQFASELDIQILENLQMNLHGKFTRQGSVGNDFSINYLSRDRTLDNDTHWLEGTITNKMLGRIVCDWSPLAHHKFKLSLTLSKIEDNKLDKEIMLGYQASY